MRECMLIREIFKYWKAKRRKFEWPKIIFNNNEKTCDCSTERQILPVHFNIVLISILYPTFLRKKNMAFSKISDVIFWHEVVTEQIILSEILFLYRNKPRLRLDGYGIRARKVP